MVLRFLKFPSMEGLGLAQVIRGNEHSHLKQSQLDAIFPMLAGLGFMTQHLPSLFFQFPGGQLLHLHQDQENVYVQLCIESSSPFFSRSSQTSESKS